MERVNNNQLRESIARKIVEKGFLILQKIVAKEETVQLKRKGF